MKALFLFSFLILSAGLAHAEFENCDKVFRGESQVSPARSAVETMLQEAGVSFGSPGDDISIHSSEFYKRILSDPDLQIGETYMDGLWDSPAVDQVTYKLMLTQERNGRLKAFLPLWRTPGLAAMALLRNAYRYYGDLLLNRQSRSRATIVAKEHYDAGNELYLKMLDPTLTYTSGRWRDGYTLEDAQNAKYDGICRTLGVKPGDHILDIGSGFGGFARFASKNYGAHVTGITISVEQLKAARAISADDPNVEFMYSDYRDIPHRFPKDTFDHVVSIEMIEAVGVKNLETYFNAAASSLKEGGSFFIQAIANNQDVINNNAWFDKYIFQNGVAPSNRQVDQAARSAFGEPVARLKITEDYDKTLMSWHANFTLGWPELRDQYDERFKRMWDFYLLSVAGGFRAEAAQLYQTVYTKGSSTTRPVIAELPSPERMAAMRQTEHQKHITALRIGALEVQKNAIELSLKPRVRPQVPLPKSARIAIVGAGPSGLSVGLELKKLGYENVTIFEKANAAGGKSHTVDIAGRAHDLGATMGVPLSYSDIEKLGERARASNRSVPERSSIQPRDR